MKITLDSTIGFFPISCYYLELKTLFTLSSPECLCNELSTDLGAISV